jgi:hypothetical protein
MYGGCHGVTRRRECGRHAKVQDAATAGEAHQAQRLTSHMIDDLPPLDARGHVRAGPVAQLVGGACHALHARGGGLASLRQVQQALAASAKQLPVANVAWSATAAFFAAVN